MRKRGEGRGESGTVISEMFPFKSYVLSAQDLDVHKIAYFLSLEIHKATLEMPKIEQYALADQLRRSTKSICANIGEGYGRQRQSSAEFKRFFVIAIGSCSESLVWLDYARDLGYITTYGSVERMLAKLRSTVK